MDSGALVSRLVAVGPPWYWHNGELWVYGRTPAAPSGAKLRLLALSGSQTVVVEPPPPPPPPGGFTLRETEPFIVDPLRPSAADLVGWDGNASNGTYTGVVTVPAGATRENCIFDGDVVLGAGAILRNVLIRGGTPNAARGLLTVASGAKLERISIVGRPSAMAYYRNCIKQTGGRLEYTRCAFFYGVDNVHRSAGYVVSHGNYYGPLAYFDNDLDHGPGKEFGSPTYWTHNDGFQATGGNGTDIDEFIGDSFDQFTDARGVTWSGGSWGSGTAIANTGVAVGMPWTALNGGYKRADVRNLTLWSNGLTFSGSAKYRFRMEDCWMAGGNGPAGLVQITSSASTGHEVWLYRNKVRMNGKGSGSNNKIRFFIYPSGTTKHIGTGADANVYDDHPSVPLALRGQALTFQASGAWYPQP